jgi:ribosome-binding factor A
MRPYRKEKVASVILQVVGESILHRLHDPRIEPLTTVTRVEMTDDLLIARVYLSIPGTEVAERKSLRAVQHAGGFLQRVVAGRLPLRHCPELRFELDKTAKHVRRTMELLAENRRNDPDLFKPESSDSETVEEESSPADDQEGGMPGAPGVGQ